MSAGPIAAVADDGRRSAHGDAVRAMFDRIAPTVRPAEPRHVGRHRSALAQVGGRPMLRAAPPRARCSTSAPARSTSRRCSRRRCPGRAGRRRATSPRRCSRRAGAKVAPRAETVVGDALGSAVRGRRVRRRRLRLRHAQPRRPRDGAREARRVLAPGGVFVVLEFFRPDAARAAARSTRYARTCCRSLGAAVARRPRGVPLPRRESHARGSCTPRGVRVDCCATTRASAIVRGARPARSASRRS